MSRGIFQQATFVSNGVLEASGASTSVANDDDGKLSP